MKMRLKKYGKMSSNFEFLISRLGCMEIFIKIFKKKLFFEIFTCEGHTRAEVSKGLIRMILTLFEKLYKITGFVVYFSNL